MSETGATAEQIEAAAKRAWAASGSLVPFDDVEPGGWFADGDKRVLAKEWSQYLVPPGYQMGRSRCARRRRNSGPMGCRV